MRKKTYLDMDAFVKECTEELKAIGIKPAETFCINLKSMKDKPGLGSCRKVIDTFVLSFEKNVCTEEANQNVLKSLVCHELLHTVKGLETHNKKFLNLSKKVNEKYGYEMLLACEFRDFYRDPNDVVGYHVCPECKTYARIYKDDDFKDETAVCRDHGIQMKKVLIKQNLE